MKSRKFNDNWKEYVLYDLANWKNGLAFNKINFSEDGYPIIKIAELKNGITSQTNFTKDKCSEEVYLRKNDLIFSWSGNPETSIDAYLYDLPEGYLNQHSFKVTPHEFINKYFLFYVLKYLKPIFKKIASNKQTTGLGHITISDLKNLRIKIPTMEIQEKFLKIIKRIDDKIKLNNQTNDNLFEISVKLFNNFLNNNKDIENVKLKECVEKINTGADAIQRAPIVEYDTGIRCIRIGDMTNNRPYHCWGFTKMTEKDFANYQLLKNDIVITRTAVNGLTYMITDEKNVVCNNGNIRLRVNKKFNPLYIYLYTKTKEFRNYIDRINSETSVRPNMKVEYLTDFSIKNLSLDNQNKICQIIQPLMTKIHKNITENHTLEQMRDTLLPKLMNGEIDLDKIEI